jgi:predicted nucleic acid-binding protein
MTEVRRIVSNTGPLISLEKLRQGYDFIRQLYDTIIIPPGVLDEVAEGQFATPQAYLQHYGIVDLLEVHAVAQSEQLPEVARLHVGEAQAIRLARELALPLLIEETVGRRVAQGLGIAISGIRWANSEGVSSGQPHSSRSAEQTAGAIPSRAY